MIAPTRAIPDRLTSSGNSNSTETVEFDIGALSPPASVGSIRRIACLGRDELHVHDRAFRFPPASSVQRLCVMATRVVHCAQEMTVPADLWTGLR